MYSFEGATQRIKPVVELPTSRAIRIPFKIFQIGFNKCGTKTLHHYFSRNGVRSVHWDYGRLAQRMLANLASGSKLLAGYEQFDVFTDMEYLNESGTYLEAYKLYRHLAEQYPHSVFILNTRNRDAWIRSRLGHGKDLSYAQRSMVHYNVTSIQELTNLWNAEWEHHHCDVTEFFARKPYRFFICQIETDLPSILDKALPECNLDAVHYRLKGGKNRRRLKAVRRLWSILLNSKPSARYMKPISLPR